MANSDKNIKITPNISASGQPNIVYTGSGNVPIALKVLDDSYGTLSFEGSAGQLFSLNNNLSSGTIFSVNDISGMPQFDVNADGTIRVAPYGSGVYMGGVGGGTFTIQPSAKSSSGAGTSVAITAGNGVTSGAGGSLILQAGRQATTGGDGKVVVKQVAGQTSNIFEVQNSSGTIYESTYIASSVVYKDISTNGSSAPLARLYAGSSEAALFLNGSGRTIKLTANNDVPNLTFTGFGQNVTFYNGSSGTTSFLIANASTGVVSFPAGAVFDGSNGAKFGHGSSGQTAPYNYSIVVGSNDVNSGNLYVNALGGGANGIQVGHNAELFWVREGGKPRVFVQSIGSSGSKNGFVGVRTESPLGQLHVVAGMNNKPVMITQAKTTNTVTVTNKQLTSNVATLTYTGTGAFKNGETITVTGVDATFNGTFTVTSATTTTVTYALVSTDVGSTASSGTITCTQTANLQEWQNSSGTVLASVSSAGRISVPTGTVSIPSLGYGNQGFTFDGSNQLYVVGANNYQSQWDLSNGWFYAGGPSGSFGLRVGGTFQMASPSVLAKSRGTGQVTLAAQAAASQTANIQEWQNSSGTALSYINASGILFDNAINSVPVASGAGNNLTLTAGSGVTSGAGGSLILQAGIQATTGGDGKVVVKQTTGQTSNLQEWQNSSSTTRAYIILSGNSSKMELGQSASGGTTDKNGITLDSSPNGTGKPTIRLFSSGEVDAQITTSTTSFSFNVGASFSGSVSSTGGLSGTSCTAQSSTTPLFRIWKTGSHFFDFDSSVANTLNIKNTSGNTITQWKEGTASVKLTVIGQSGQTANLQEWQNSSSGILTSIGPSGGINLLPYGTSSGNTNEIRFLELAANGTHSVGFKAADTIPSNTTWILPSGDGATGQALITNGSGLLSWGTISNLSSYTNTSAGTTSAYDLGTSNFVKANPSTSGLTINGFSSSGSYDGRMLKLVNVSNYNINIINTGTTVCVGGNNIVLGPKDGADLILDSGASVWRVF